LIRSVKGAVRRARVTSESRWWTIADLLFAMVRRELEARYKGSVLGNLWPLLNQLSQLLIYTYVFSIVLKVKLNLAGLPENNVTFGLWLFAGLLPWTAFVGGFAQANLCVVAQPSLVKKIVFPLSLLPLVPVLATFIESSLGLMALVALVALTTQTLHNTLWLLPLVWLPQLLLTSGLAYLGASLTVFLRDIPQSISVFLNIWFYLTPIVYPMSAIPEFLRQGILWLNPMSAIVQLYRDVILVGSITHPLTWLTASVTAIVVFLFGFVTYRRLRPAFADVL